MNSEHPYRIPADGYKRTINFSGGRSSAFMLWNIVKEHGGELPPNVAVIFCNTGKEREETLVFVDQVQRHLGIPITWLEYRYRWDARGGIKDPKNSYVKVDYDTASRSGTPFNQLITKGQILPNVRLRKCTAEMKIETTKRFCYHELGWRTNMTKRVIGYRYDEKHRWGRALTQEGTCDLEFPMVYAFVTRAHVDRFWKEEAPFDLGIRSDQGNCDLCFLKGKAKLLNLIREDPSLVDWWMETEEKALGRWGGRLKKVKMCRFSERWTYRELKDMAAATPELKFDEELDINEQEHCFCTD